MNDQRMTTTPEPQPTYRPPQTTPLVVGPQVTDEEITAAALAGRDVVIPPMRALQHSVEAANTPPWNGLDTFLRRGVMIAAFILLWVAVALGALAVVGAGYIGSRLNNTSTVDTSPTGLYPTDLPVAPGPGLCDIDPWAEGC